MIERLFRQRRVLLGGTAPVVERCGGQHDFAQLDRQADARGGWQLVGPRQALAGDAQCFVVGKEPQTKLSCRHHRACGQCRVAALGSVVREIRGALGVEGRITLEQFRDAPVHRASPGRGDAAVDAAGNELMGKAKTLSGGLQHRPPCRGLEDFADPVPVDARDARQRFGVDPRREYGRPAQDVSIVAGKTREPLLHELTERLTTVAREFGACELDREQRVAAAVHAESLAARTGCVCVDELAQRFHGQRSEPDLLKQIGLAQLAQGARDGGIVAQLVGARREQTEQRLSGFRASHEVQRGRARLVTPVHVIETDHDRLPLEPGGEQRAQALEEMRTVAWSALPKIAVAVAGSTRRNASTHSANGRIDSDS